MPLPRQGVLDSEDRWGEIHRAVEDGYLIKKPDESILLNEDDPAIRKAVKALSALRGFINQTSELAEPYENKHGHQLDFASRRFWDTNLPK